MGAMNRIPTETMYPRSVGAIPCGCPRPPAGSWLSCSVANNLAATRSTMPTARRGSHFRAGWVYPPASAPAHSLRSVVHKACPIEGMREGLILRQGEVCQSEVGVAGDVGAIVARQLGLRQAAQPALGIAQRLSRFLILAQIQFGE